MLTITLEFWLRIVLNLVFLFLLARMVRRQIEERPISGSRWRHAFSEISAISASASIMIYLYDAFILWFPNFSGIVSLFVYYFLGPVLCVSSLLFGLFSRGRTRFLLLVGFSFLAFEWSAWQVHHQSLRMFVYALMYGVLTVESIVYWRTGTIAKTGRPQVSP